MRTGIVAPDIAALNAAAGVSLPAGFFHTSHSFSGNPLNKIAINTAAVHNAVTREVDIVAAGVEYHAIAMSSISKMSGKLPHRGFIG